jgi:hypothetical protein
MLGLETATTPAALAARWKIKEEKVGSGGNWDWLPFFVKALLNTVIALAALAAIILLGVVAILSQLGSFFQIGPFSTKEMDATYWTNAFMFLFGVIWAGVISYTTKWFGRGRG